MSGFGGPPARPGGSQLIRLALHLPNTDLALSGKRGGPVELDDSHFGLSLVLPYGIGPDEPHLFRVDASGRLLVATEAAAPLALGPATTAAVLAAQSETGALQVAQPGQWAVLATPAAGLQATVTRAAAGAGIRHICSAVLISWGAVVAPVATLVGWVLRDGLTGVGTPLAAGWLAVPAAPFSGTPVTPTGLQIVGSPNTAMTLEFTLALANLSEGVTLIGSDAA